jgi:hypothetical protein
MSSQILEYNHSDFKAILAIDFDLTICMSEYPELGVQRKDSVYYIKQLAAEGYGIVINTCRSGLALADAINWLHEKKVPYHYVNCNFPHLISMFKADCRKVSADVHIDDKNLGGLPEWYEIYNVIKKKYGK